MKKTELFPSEMWTTEERRNFSTPALTAKRKDKFQLRVSSFSDPTTSST